MRNNPRSIFYPIFFVLFVAHSVARSQSAGGHWEISQLPFGSNGMMPVINNSNEVVWATQGQGIYSNIRGQLTTSGIFPRLANSGEVVYADWFGGPLWDLVSTTRGRLTYGSIIDVNATTFDVNSAGEVVYATKDTNSQMQIYSTVRGQLTFGTGTHTSPCINDRGEIIWSQYTGGPEVTFSTTRGVIPGIYGGILSLNNHGDLCYSGSLEGPPGYYTSPHIFSYFHGVILNDTNQFQWYGGMNDAETIVYNAPETPGSGTWYFYKAAWISADTNPPVIESITAAPKSLWPAHNQMVSVKLHVVSTDDIDPAPVSQIISVSVNRRGSPFFTYPSEDWLVTGPLTVKLRAIHDEQRVYTVMVKCSDASGNASTNSIKIGIQSPFLR